MTQPPPEHIPGIIYTTKHRPRSIHHKLPELPLDTPSEAYEQAPSGYVRATDGIFYAKEPRQAQIYSEDNSLSSTASAYSALNRTKRNRMHGGVQDPDGFWIIPHNSSSSREGSTSKGTSRYVTPGGRYLNRTPKKHTAGTQFVGTEQIIPGQPASDNVSQEDLDELSRLSNLSSYRPSTMTVSI